MTPDEIKQRSITITGDGNLRIIGKWKIDELLTLGRMLIDTANAQVIEFKPQTNESVTPAVG